MRIEDDAGRVKSKPIVTVIVYEDWPFEEVDIDPEFSGRGNDIELIESVSLAISKWRHVTFYHSTNPSDYEKNEEKKTGFDKKRYICKRCSMALLVFFVGTVSLILLNFDTLSGYIKRTYYTYCQ